MIKNILLLLQLLLVPCAWAGEPSGVASETTFLLRYEGSDDKGGRFAIVRAGYKENEPIEAIVMKAVLPCRLAPDPTVNPDERHAFGDRFKDRYFLVSGTVRARADMTDEGIALIDCRDKSLKKLDLGLAQMVHERLRILSLSP